LEKVVKSDLGKISHITFFLIWKIIIIFATN
jgi:hypothetical protein